MTPQKAAGRRAVAINFPANEWFGALRQRKKGRADAAASARTFILPSGELVLLIDPTTREIYVRAERDQINSWLRTLAQIRQSPATWPTRWPRREAP